MKQPNLKDIEQSRGLINAVICLLGGKSATARAMNITRSQIHRYLTGQTVLAGTADVAARCIVRHPEDFERFKVRK